MPTRFFKKKVSSYRSPLPIIHEARVTRFGWQTLCGKVVIPAGEETTSSWEEVQSEVNCWQCNRIKKVEERNA